MFIINDKIQGSPVFEILRSLRFLRMTDKGYFQKLPCINSILAKTPGHACVSIPLLIILVSILNRWGFAIATDLLSALIMGVISRKAAIEILIISLFVISGSRLASWVTAKFF